ncbi:hypothetical protein Ocin01_00813 [Orchesella cincta]|uniref:Uncharacterized protein n=1 Tax=Orchesella cincta TaxID=48709 RepID=A0A1D2NLR2_ORCCI|nr:hypothetical protein Ocin01_00813 [Orchesella cincta]
MFSKASYLKLIYFVSCSSFIAGQRNKGYGHSSLVLFRGAEREEVDAKDCPVGIAFYQPQIFSCACINGIWAFYDNPCEAPVAVIGGNNHCFKMPSRMISLAMAVSNPLKGLGDSLTVFENDMESMRSKIYRSLHMSLNAADVFVSLNTSWTLTSPDGTKSVCLANKVSDLETGDAEELPFPEVTYCSYVDVSREIPFIGGISKGCNSSMELDPIRCETILPPNGEEVCLEPQILAAYVDSTKINLDPVMAANYLESEDEPLQRISRTLNNLGKFQPTSAVTKRTSKITTQSTTEHYAKAYKDEPNWHQKSTTGDSEGIRGRSLAASPTASNTSSTSASSMIPTEEVWQNPQAFLMPPPTTSNQLVTNHLWMYQRMAIRNALNITRLVPPDEEMSVQVDTGKVKKLLSVHAEIMKKVCPLVPESIFDIFTSTFLGILTKGFRWREPYVEQTHYLRILTALTLCKDSAAPMKFKAVQQCNMKGSEFIILTDKDSKGDVNVPLQIPEVFKSENFEPVIEAAWKTFISVHSYCFKDFSDQFQDHHKYTTLMMGLFTNQLHDIWIRNKTVPVEYAGVLGNIGETMGELEKCAVGSRMGSEYPFHMTRPTKLVRYKGSNIMISKRKKRSVPTFASPTKSISEDIHIRKKRLAVNSLGSDSKVQIMNGKGICLKKYSDSRTTVGSHCKV